jgi:hypothetical protein
MSKKLNNSTLGLRFMQNAQRAKNPSEATTTPNTTQASPPDDAEWHLPQNVRDAWPLSTNSSNAVSEPSYLPFLFHAEDEVSPSLFKGRRSFVHGKEVIPVCFATPAGSYG